MPTVTHLTNQSQFVQSNAVFAGTNATGTIASSGISVSVNPQTSFVFSNSNGVTFGTNGSTVTASVQTNYLTSQSNQALSAANGSFTFQTANFANSNGVSFSTGTQGIYATVATNYQSQGAYLTTARASNDAVGLNTAATNVTWTVNSSGISLNAGGYLTTAANSTHSHGNPTLNLTNLSGTTASASNGFTLSLSAAAPGAGGGIANAAGTQTATSGTVLFNNANGITFGMSNSSVITASYNSTQFQSTGNYLTTARASNDAVGLNTAATNVTWTVNSSGISLNASAYLTTAMASNRGSDFVQATAAFAGTNASGTIASNGISISVAAPGGGGGAGTNTALNLTNLTGTLSVNTNGVSLSMSAAAPGGGGGGYSINQFENIPYVTMTNLSNMTATRFTQRPHFYPFELGGSLTHNVLMFEASRATSGSNAFTMQAALYSMANSTQLSLIASLQNVFSNTETASISGIRRFHLTGWGTAGTALTPGQYVLMLMNSGTATASMNYSYRGGLTAVPPVGVILGGTDQVQTATSYLSNAAGWRDFWGNYTTTTNAPPTTVAKTQIQNWTSGNNLYFYMGRT